MTAWTAALALPIALLAWLGIALGQVAVVRAQAQSSADLAVLAAAQAPGGECAAAERLVEANARSALSPRIRLVRCEAAAGEARVEVEAALPSLAGRAMSWLGAQGQRVRAQARAGLP